MRKHPWPRSFRRRQGELTRAQRRALREHWPALGLDAPYGSILDLNAAFDSTGPFTLEIGFGMGQSLAEEAHRDPVRCFLGLETHRPGLGAMLQRSNELGLRNVRLVRGDALRLLKDHLDSAWFDRVHVLFPDPWPKPADACRRLVRPFFLDQLEPRLLPGATLHIATDVAVYADSVDAALTQRAGWSGGRLAERPDRPPTQYEQRAHTLGHTITDFIWSWSPPV
jgi:tRNA (guanine-N7-)-methyltransferase